MEEDSGFPHEIKKASKRGMEMLRGFGKLVTPEYMVKRTQAETRDLYHFFQNEYGIKIRSGPATQGEKDSQSIDHIEKANLYEVRESLKALREEFQKYPAEYIKNSQLETIRVVRALELTKEFLGDRFGEGSVHQNIRGFARPKEHTFYIVTGDEVQIEYMLRKLYPYVLDFVQTHQVLRDTIHHELTHLADAGEVERAVIRSQGKMDRADAIDELESRWEALNPAGSEAYYYDNQPKVPYIPAPRPEGFVNFLSQSYSFEDRACTTALLMKHPQEALKLMEKDPVVKSKIEAAARLLKQRSGGYMDMHWLADHFAGRKITPDYYKTRTY